MDLTLIQGTITGLKSAADIAKAMLELKSLADVQDRVIALQSAILSAQSSALAANADQAAMVVQIRDLQDDLARLKRWEAERERYRLVSPWSGGFVYALRREVADGQPPHWLCTKCYEDARKSIVNPKQDAKGWYTYVCPSCKSEVLSPWKGPATPAFAEDTTPQ